MKHVRLWVYPHTDHRAWEGMDDTTPDILMSKILDRLDRTRATVRLEPGPGLDASIIDRDTKLILASIAEGRHLWPEDAQKSAPPPQPTRQELII